VSQSVEDDERLVGPALRTEIRGWRSRRGPDLHDLMRRADHSWRHPILVFSGAGVAALALLLVAAIMFVAMAPPGPAAEIIRERLLAP
jgi:hypothetical protein